MSKIAAEIAEALTNAVRSRGMARFITHEVIGKGVFCPAWTSGMGATEEWKDILTNTQDNEIAAITSLTDSFSFPVSLCFLDLSFSSFSPSLLRVLKNKQERALTL